MTLRLRYVALVPMLVACAYVSVLARATSVSASTGACSISGVVTADGRPAAGVPVWATSGGSRDDDVRPTETDAAGRYRIDALAPGTYVVSAFKVGYFPPSEHVRLQSGTAGRIVTLDAGESEESFDIALTRGGVITGRATDTAGRSLVNVSIAIETLEDGRLREADHAFAEYLRTDDRGVYRAYGLRPGRYFVAAHELGDESEIVPKTYAPSTLDPKTAAPVEILGAEEATGVDLVVAIRRPGAHAAVSGRVVDPDTGAPAGGVRVLLAPIDEDRESDLDSSREGRSTETGAFRIANVAFGHYQARTLRPCGEDCWYYSGVVDVDVTADVDGLVVPSSRGTTVSGHVVVEGVSDPTVASRISTLEVSIYSLDDFSAFNAGLGNRSLVAADGAFRVEGLGAGRHHVLLSARGEAAGFHLFRVEGVKIDGDGAIELDAGHDVADARLVVGYGSCAIRGEVRFVNGTLAPGARVSVEVSSDERRDNEFPELDARMRFLRAGMLSGRYTVTGRVAGVRDVSQSVTLSEGRPSVDVTLTIDLSALEPESHDDDEEDEEP